MDNNPALRQRAEALDASRWRRLHRPAPYQSSTGQTRKRRPNHKQRIVAERGYLNLDLQHEDVAEFFYVPGKCARAYRVVVVRKNISRSRGENVLFDEIRYLFYITTRTDLTAARSCSWPTNAATRKTSSGNSSPASAPCGYRCTTWYPTGCTWSPPPSPGTSNHGSP
jgi:hypothetical protein